jgi:hypothetical protein
MRCHLIAIRMVTIKKTKDNKCLQCCGERALCTVDGNIN